MHLTCQDRTHDKYLKNYCTEDTKQWHFVTFCGLLSFLWVKCYMRHLQHIVNNSRSSYLTETKKHLYVSTYFHGDEWQLLAIQFAHHFPVKNIHLDLDFLASSYISRTQRLQRVRENTLWEESRYIWGQNIMFFNSRESDMTLREG